MKAAQHRYFKGFTAGFTKSLRQAVATTNKKNIHALRVSIKKLHALLLYLEYVAPEKVNSKKTYRKFSKLFTEAGELRTMQMRKELLTELKNKKSVAKELKKLDKEMKRQEKRLQQQLEKFRRKYLVSKIESAIKKGLAETDIQTATKRIYAFALSSIKTSVQSSEKEVLHNARKHLKDARYLLEILHTDVKAKGMLKAFIPLEKKIGRWHDLVDSAHFLKKLSVEKKDAKTHAQLKSAARKLNKEIAKLESETKTDFKQMKNKVIKAI